jgi:deoxyribodipyrimidine photolyase-related protein
MSSHIRRLVIVLGDQLDRDSAALDGFDPARVALFLSAMRHFRDEMRGRGYRVEYRALDDDGNAGTLAGELRESIRRLRPASLVMAEPGDHRVRESLLAAAADMGVDCDIRADRHFYCGIERFREFASGRKQLRMEHFYRQMRREHGVLMDGDAPAGGEWNYDADNRGSFGKGGPGLVPAPVAFTPDATTREVLALVARRFADHPGSLEHFDWPVTPEQAREALDDFVAHRLERFGDFQDAMWTGRAYLYHSRISAAMNLKLLPPREAVAAAEAAYRAGRAPLASAEGFIRQVLGWREYVRGIYWTFMPDYARGNALGAREPLPAFYWTGETDMNCLRQCVTQTLEFGYAHHIQRLMVTGLYALLLGVDPYLLHEWYLAVYVDAVEWVELPNVVGMSQFADGGVMASKPYAASGKYIDRMSNYCKGCRYDPEKSTGDDACPFTTLYWDFLMRHEAILARNVRMKLQVKNAERLSLGVRRQIREQAERHRLEVRS